MIGSSPDLVTGASGFIGAALTRALLEAGRQVCAVLRRPEARRIEALGSQPDLETIVVGEEPWTTELLRNSLGRRGFARVFHLAAAGVGRDVDDPAALIRGNVGPTIALIETLEREPPEVIVFTGSCSEYAPAPPGSLIEETHAVQPRSLYGAAKASASLCGAALARRYELPLVRLRLFGIYGPGEASRRLLPYLIDRLSSGLPVDLTAGEQQRDMLYIDDAVDALGAAATLEPGDSPPVFNVCSGMPVTVKQVAKTVAKYLGADFDLLDFGARPYRPEEPMWVVGSPERFSKATGWEPVVTLKEGVQRTVRWRLEDALG